MLKVFEIGVPSYSETNTVYKTNLRWPEGRTLISRHSLLTANPSLDKNQSYTKNDFIFNIGKSTDGYIQYSIIKYSYPENGNTIFLTFI